jgi:tol-pal system protein YbgF
VLSFVIEAKDASINELSESVRTLTGKVEELTKNNDELQKRVSFLEDLINKKNEEEVLANKSPEEIIKSAKDMIKEKNMNGARQLLKAFISKNPKSIYCGMMLFYIGKSFFKENDYRNAALEYMKSYKTNPTGSKAAKALYKLAQCFKELSETVKCKSILEKIINDYPGRFAEKASKELKKLK